MIINKRNLEKTKQDLKRLKEKFSNGLINRKNYEESKASLVRKYNKIKSGLNYQKSQDNLRRKRKKNPRKKLYGFMDLF